MELDFELDAKSSTSTLCSNRIFFLLKGYLLQELLNCTNAHIACTHCIVCAPFAASISQCFRTVVIGRHTKIQAELQIWYPHCGVRRMSCQSFERRSSRKWLVKSVVSLSRACSHLSLPCNSFSTVTYDRTVPRRRSWTYNRCQIAS